MYTLTPTDRHALHEALADVYTKILQTVGTEFTAIGSIREKTSNHQCSYTVGSMTFRPSETAPLPCPEGCGPFLSSAQDWISAVMNRRREGYEDVPERPERHEENRIRVLNALKEYDQVRLQVLYLNMSASDHRMFLSTLTIRRRLLVSWDGLGRVLCHFGAWIFWS